MNDYRAAIADLYLVDSRADFSPPPFPYRFTPRHSRVYLYPAIPAPIYTLWIPVPIYTPPFPRRFTPRYSRADLYRVIPKPTYTR